MAKLALLTGGSRGIGCCTLDLLRTRGWDVLAPTRAELDFSRRDSVKDYWLNYKLQYHAMDALIFCHGTWYSEPLYRQYISHYDDQFVERVVMPAALIDWMLSYRLLVGSATIVASTQAFGGRYQTSPYGVACAAQVRLMQGFANSYTGVRFNTVCPGLSATSMAAQVIASGDCRPDAVPQAPEAVAAVIVGLVEDGTSNGRVVRVVDGKASDAKWTWE